MEEERHYNELTGYGHVGSLGVSVTPVNRSRTTSSPVPTNRPLSPSNAFYNPSKQVLRIFLLMINFGKRPAHL